MSGLIQTLRRLWLALAAVAAVQDASAADWYQVEVLAFRYTVEENAAWSPAPALPDFAQALRLAPVPEDSAATSGPTAWQTLPAHELRLAGARQALARTGRVDLLFHTGWRQRAGEGRPVYLSSPAEATGTGGMPKPFVEGAVNLAPAGPGFRLASRFVAHTVEASILLGESRALVEGDLHYLDHPLVGVILQVTAYMPPGAGPSSSDSVLPLNPLPQPAAGAPPR
ncbi:MAG: hypothetical protein FJ164_06430 [Gammaproteobacteria bacterium]|nr:hypothetical protein [Gammaproteobacteria bacterium]